MALVNHPATTHERPVLIELLEQLHSAAEPAAFSALHTGLLARYLGRQRLRDELRAAKSGVGATIATVAAQVPKDISALRAQQERLEQIDHDAFVQIALAAHTRGIADGLVWKALAYDRAATTILNRGVRVDRLADDGVGLQAELEVLALLETDPDTVTIHNDVATILRHGDLTTINPSRHSVHMREVKAGPAADGAQVIRGSAAIELINDREAVDPQTGRTVYLHRLPVKSQTFAGALAELVAESRSDGYAHRRLGSMQHVTVIDYRAWAGREDELDARDAAVRRSLRWGPEHKTFTWLASLRRIQDRQATFGSLVPLAIFPLDPPDLADLMLGYLELRTMLRCDLLEAGFAARGLAATVAFPAPDDDTFLSVGSGNLRVNILPDVREQLLAELVTPQTVIETVAATLELLADSSSPEQEFLPGIDESDIWA
jgi:hypothetical protein